MFRRSVVALVTVFSVIFGPMAPSRSAVAAPDLPPSSPAIAYRLAEVVTGLSSPVFVTHAGDDRLFVVLRGGSIRIAENGALRPTPFLTLTDRISTAGEGGLLGLAFEPAYAGTGRLYVYYVNTSGNIVIERFNRSAGDANLADRSTGQVVLDVPHPTYTNHNGGWIGFGPDGYLYTGPGDGGGGGNPFCAAQNVADLRGKILRLDVAGQVTYTTPASNAFTPTQRPEVFAVGLRNPFRMSFDRLTGDLYVGDVGQDAREEISRLPAGSGAGANLGWSSFEGSVPYNNACPWSGLTHTLPILEYAHAAEETPSCGVSVTGGYVYRGQRYGWLQGTYFYGDFCSGKIWGGWSASPGVWSSTLITDTSFRLASFGEDSRGELYVADFSGGRVLRLESSLPYRIFAPSIMREHPAAW